MNTKQVKKMRKQLNWKRANLNADPSKEELALRKQYKDLKKGYYTPKQLAITKRMINRLSKEREVEATRQENASLLESERKVRQATKRAARAAQPENELQVQARIRKALHEETVRNLEHNESVIRNKLNMAKEIEKARVEADKEQKREERMKKNLKPALAVASQNLQEEKYKA